jgi:hypothetical protein
MTTALLQRKTLDAVELKAGDEGAFRATFATLAPAVDKDGDVTLPGAFPVGKQVPISAYGHASWQGALPVGIGTIGADSQTAWVSGRFFLDTTGGRDTYLTVKHQSEVGLGSWSYGYEVQSWSYDPAELRNYPSATRILKKVDVFEVSPVLVAAGLGTRTDYVKAAKTLDDQMQALRRRFDPDPDLALLKAEADLAISRAQLIEAGLVEAARRTYAEVQPGAVPSKSQQLAGRVLRSVCGELAIPAPAIRWFSEEGPREKAYAARWGARDWHWFRSDPIWGMAKAYANEIWIRADLEAGDLAETIAHEVRHIAQGPAPCGHDEQAEAEAAVYGRAARRRALENRFVA